MSRIADPRVYRMRPCFICGHAIEDMRTAVTAKAGGFGFIAHPACADALDEMMHPRPIDPALQGAVRAAVDQAMQKAVEQPVEPTRKHLSPEDEAIAQETAREILAAMPGRIRK